MTEFIKMCYYSAWAAYRDGDQALKPEDVDAHHCTHLALAYGTIDDSGKRVKFPDVFEDMHLYVIFLGSILLFFFFVKDVVYSGIELSSSDCYKVECDE